MSRVSQQHIAKYAGNSIRYNTAFSHMLGSVSAALMLSQLLYWSNMGHRHDGYFFKTVEEFFYETGLTRHQQHAAVKILKSHDLIFTKVAGIPAKRHFYVDETAIQSMLTTWKETAPPDILKALFQLTEKRTTITETTHKITQNTNTVDVLSISSRASDKHRMEVV